MRRDEAFVAAVQAGVLSMGPNALWPSKRDVYDVVARAARITEWSIPEDVAKAARDFVRFAIGMEAAPEWYLEWQETVTIEELGGW